MSSGGGEGFNLSCDLGSVLHHLALDVKHEGLLSKVGVYDLSRSLESDGRIQAGRQLFEGDPQVVSVLGVEAGAVDEVNAAADDVSRGESRAVGLARARRAKGVAVVAVITV